MMNKNIFYLLPCFIVPAICSYFLFENIYICLVSTVCCGIMLLHLLQNRIKKKSEDTLRLQFIDFLDFLNSSIMAGNNTFNSLIQVHDEMKRIHGEKSLIADESLKIRRGLENSESPETLLFKMGENCDIEEIKIFADSFKICNRSGGNISKLISDSKRVISEKIRTESEISTILASSKNEVYILFVMPFIVSLAMKYMLNYKIDNLTLVVRIIAVIIFIIAFYIGQRITDIKI